VSEKIRTRELTGKIGLCMAIWYQNVIQVSCMTPNFTV